MLRRSALVIAALGVACIKLADFHPGGGSGSGSPDARTADAAMAGECGIGFADQATALMSGSATICEAGPSYVLRFPTRGFRFPDELVIGTQQVLGTSGACNEEDRMGVEAYPAARFSSDSPATPTTATASIILAGPVVAKVAVNWTWHATGSCAAGGTFSGTSTFTAFPDGRLVRFDQLTTPQATSQGPCDCATAAQGFNLEAYVTFGTTVMLTDQGGTQIPPSSGTGQMLPQLFCASGNDYAIGISERMAGRARNVTGGGIGVTTDFDASLSPMLSAGTATTVTAYQIGTGTCAPLLPPIEQYNRMTTNPQLNVAAGGNNTTIPTERDGMFGGDNGAGTALPTAGGTLTLTAPGDPIPPGWALSIANMHLGTPTATPARTGDWFKIQNGTTDAIIWFRDGLGSGETITVPPQ